MNFKFNVGDKVMVVKTKRTSREYSNTVNRVGEIRDRACYMGMVRYSIKFDGLINPYCGNGLFIYTEKELTNVKTGDDTMDNKYILHGLKGVAQVEFIEGTNTERTYQYLYYDESINVGDAVVVKSAHHGFGVAVVDALITDHYAMEDLATNGDTINREIVSKFDYKTYTERKDLRVKMAENDAKRKKLMAAMDKRIAESRNMAYYEKMAESDDEIKAMLEQLKAID